MMRIRIIIFVLLFPLINSCDKQATDSEQDYFEYPAKVIYVEIVNLSQQHIEFYTIAEVPSPCNYYSKTEITHEIDDYFITIFSRYDGEPCLGVLDTIQANISINPTSGNKTFHFWYSDSTNIDTTISIP